MKIDVYFKPRSLEDAYSLYKSSSNAVIIGGGAFLRLSNRHAKMGIDLSEIGLDFIKESAEDIQIGAMTTFRTIELNKTVQNYYGGVLASAAGRIMGVQMRNIATVGGTISGRYGFSDFITALLSLDCDVVLYKAGTMPLKDYLNFRGKDIVHKIVLKKAEGKAVYKDFRNTSNDFPMLNVAAALTGNEIKLAVGARPGTAVLALEAAEFLNSSTDKTASAEKAGEIAAEALEFGSDLRASEEYRRQLCKVLVKRAVLEVIS